MSEDMKTPGQIAYELFFEKHGCHVFGNASWETVAQRRKDWWESFAIAIINKTKEI